LDQFRSNNNDFTFTDIYNYSSFGQWNTHRSFGQSRMNSLAKNPLINYSTYYNLSFDQLNYFGFYFANNFISHSLSVRVAGGQLEESSKRCRKRSSAGNFETSGDYGANMELEIVESVGAAPITVSTDIEIIQTVY